MVAKGDKSRIIERAERFVRAGRLSEAIAEYEKLLEDESPEPAIYNIIGDLYLRLGDNERAINYFRRAAEAFENQGGSSQALAIVKKITKILPDDPEFILKTGDLLRSQGFSREAEKEYLRAIEIFRRKKAIPEIISIYEKLVNLNRENIDYRLELAEYYVGQGKLSEALNQFNETAELLLSRNEIDRAYSVLVRASEVDPLDERTAGHLLQVLKKKGEIDQALQLVQKLMKKAPDNLGFRYWLGSLLMDKNEVEKAQEIFESILLERPTEARARVQLGKIYVGRGELARAYELYEPLINSLLKKKKEEKAIGLLGIILSGPALYLPALEKLASIYRLRKEKNNLEIVLRAILEEAKQQKMKDKMYAAVSELVELVPDDEELLKQYWSLRRELGLEKEAGEPATETDEEFEELLARADIYIHQGLYRNARRILENLSLQRPDDTRIRERLELIDQAKIEVPEEELVLRVEKISAIESEIEKRPGGARSFLSFLRETGALDEKVTSAEIFHGTDILPLNVAQKIERRFYNLEDRVKEEIEAIRMAIMNQLLKGREAAEKELHEIIHEFKRQAKVKLGAEDYETHFQLGLAFLEQGLFDEAIEELMLSAQSPEKALESCTLIAEAFRRKKDYSEAIRWLEKCLELCQDDPEKLHSLEYEIASLYEKLQDRPRALSFYNKILKWNASFRDVAKRVAALQRAS